MRRKADSSKKVQILAESLGYSFESIMGLFSWVLSEELFDKITCVYQQKFLQNQKDFGAKVKLILKEITNRDWPTDDILLVINEVQTRNQKHYRKPVKSQDLLSLLLRSELKCQHCNKTPPEVVLHVDHILPVSKGGRSSSDNLQFLCSHCNQSKSNKKEALYKTCLKCE